MKLKLLLASSVLLLSATANAALNGPDGAPWKATADTVNSPGHSGLIVTDVTYAQCVVQFQNAMDNHAAAHGDTFTNIHYCHYNPGSGYINGYPEKELAVQLQNLEGSYNISEYEQKKGAILKAYFDKLEVIPDASKEVSRK